MGIQQQKPDGKGGELSCCDIINTFILGDCMDVMHQLPDKFVDVAIVDPPYGPLVGSLFKKRNDGRYGVGGRGIYDTMYDNTAPSDEYFSELMRVSKHQIIFGFNFFCDKLRPTSCVIVWDKNVAGDNSDCELAWTSFSTPIRKVEYTWSGWWQQRREKRIHPSQKPIGLYEWIVERYTEPGDLILDTHSGSGSLAIAAALNNRRFIAIEIMPEFYEASKKRFEEYVGQAMLFRSETKQEGIWYRSER